MKRIMTNLALAAWLLTVLLGGNAVAAPAPFRPEVPEQYRVQKGDTLWDIAALYLREPWRWPEIWRRNPHIDNPHLIYPGDLIRLEYIDGQPRFALDRGRVSAGRNGRTLKLSPEIRETQHARAIPALPLAQVNSFLSRNLAIDPAALDAAPHVLAAQQQHVLATAGDDVYARGDFADAAGFYGIYRKGDQYIDPVTREVLGIRAQDIGAGEVTAVSGDVATLRVTRATQEIEPGDRLLPTEERRMDSTFYPYASAAEIQGQMIAVEGAVQYGGHLDVVALNRGERDGVEVGNMLAVYQPGERLRDTLRGDDIELPAERAGLVMVFRTFAKMSYGLVLEANRPLAVGDLVRNP